MVLPPVIWLCFTVTCFCVAIWRPYEAKCLAWFTTTTVFGPEWGVWLVLGDLAQYVFFPQVKTVLVAALWLNRAVRKVPEVMSRFFLAQGYFMSALCVLNDVE